MRKLGGFATFGVVVAVIALFLAFASIPVPPPPKAQPAAFKTTPKRDLVKVQYETTKLPKGRYAKVGFSEIVFCRDSGKKHRNLKAASLPYTSRSAERARLWATDQCFSKTLEFQYEIVDRSLFGGAVLIYTGIGLQGTRYLWTNEKKLQRQSVQSYGKNSKRELFDTLRWD